MAFENLSDMMQQLTFENLLSGDFSAFIPIFYLAIAIAIYAIVIWHFYRFISRRDFFEFSGNTHPGAVAFLSYFFLFPFVAIVFFIGLSLMLIFLTKSFDICALLSTSFGVIIAIRIAAYYNENMAQDVAKLLPLALLGVVLVDPSYFNLEDILDKIYALPDAFILCIQLLLFIIVIEWILRIFLKIGQSVTSRR